MLKIARLTWKVHEFIHHLFTSSLSKNVLSLYMLQFANYVLPLITVPYLVRVLGPEKFGVIAFGQSLMMYFVLLVNYGFDWSATRAIAVQRGNLQQVGHIASAVWGAKILLCALSFILLAGSITLIPHFQKTSTLLYILFSIVVGNMLFPQWLFQGLERMVTVAVINLTIRALITVSIFMVIHQPEDFLKYAGLLGVQWLSTGILGFVWGIRWLHVPITIPSWEDITQIFHKGWAIFLSTTAISFYTTGNAFILGLLTNNTVVGYYAAAEKIVKAVLGLISPLSQGFYPRVSHRASLSKKEGLQWAKRALLSMGGVGLAISVGLLVGAPLVVGILLGPQYKPSIIVLRILSLLPLLIALSNVFGVQLMLPFHLDRPFLSILIIAGFVNVSLALLLVPIWQANGMATAVTVTEFYVTTSMFFYLKVKGLMPSVKGGVL